MWKRQYTDLGVQDLRELRSLREENGRLKWIVADLTGRRRTVKRPQDSLRDNFSSSLRNAEPDRR